MICPVCGSDNPSGLQYCIACACILRSAGKPPLPGERPPAGGAPALADASEGAEAALATPRPQAARPAAADWRVAAPGIDTSSLLAVAAWVVLTFVFTTLAYKGARPLSEALTAAAVFAVAWPGLFSLGPLVRRFAPLAAGAALLGGAVYLAWSLGLTPLNAIFLAAVAIAVLAALMFALPIVPGLLAAAALYRFMHGQSGAALLAVAGFVVVTGAVFAAWASFAERALPFGKGFVWSFVTGALAHRLALALLVGSRAAAWADAVRGLSLLPLSSLVPRALGLVEALLLISHIPPLVWLWLVLVAGLTGIITLLLRTSPD